MKENKVVVKERDESSSLAEFIGNMVAKYADVINFDVLPETDVYLAKRFMLESYKAYRRERNKIFYLDVEVAEVA